MTSFMALDGVTSFLRLKDVTITCKRMRRSLSIGGSSSVQWRKVGRNNAKMTDALNIAVLIFLHNI